MSSHDDDAPASIRTPSRAPRRLGIASFVDLSICISLPSSSIPPHRSRTLTLAEEIISGLPSDDSLPERDQSWHVCVMDQAIEIVDSDDAFNMASANAYTLLQFPNHRNTFAFRVVTDPNHTFAGSDQETYLSVATSSSQSQTSTQTSTDTSTETSTHTSTASKSKHESDDEDDEPSTSRVRFQLEDKKPTTTTTTTTTTTSTSTSTSTSTLLDPNQRQLTLCTTSIPSSSELFEITQVTGLSRCRITCPSHNLIWAHSHGHVILRAIDHVESDDPSTHFTLALHTTTQASYAAARERALSMLPSAQQAQARQLAGIKRLDALFASLKAS